MSKSGEVITGQIDVLLIWFGTYLVGIGYFTCVTGL